MLQKIILSLKNLVNRHLAIIKNYVLNNFNYAKGKAFADFESYVKYRFLN